jgi:hypothetical protein
MLDLEEQLTKPGKLTTEFWAAISSAAIPELIHAAGGDVPTRNLVGVWIYIALRLLYKMFLSRRSSTL